MSTQVRTSTTSHGPDSSVVESVLWVISTLVRGLGFNPQFGPSWRDYSFALFCRIFELEVYMSWQLTLPLKGEILHSAFWQNASSKST